MSFALNFGAIKRDLRDAFEVVKQSSPLELAKMMVDPHEFVKAHRQMQPRVKIMLQCRGTKLDV